MSQFVPAVLGTGVSGNASTRVKRASVNSVPAATKTKRIDKSVGMQPARGRRSLGRQPLGAGCAAGWTGRTRRCGDSSSRGSQGSSRRGGVCRGRWAFCTCRRFCTSRGFRGRCGCCFRPGSWNCRSGELRRGSKEVSRGRGCRGRNVLRIGPSSWREACGADDRGDCDSCRGRWGSCRGGWLVDRFLIGRPYRSINGFPSFPTRNSPGLSRGSLECGVGDMAFIINAIPRCHRINTCNKAGCGAGRPGRPRGSRAEPNSQGRGNGGYRLA